MNIMGIGLLSCMLLLTSLLLGADAPIENCINVSWGDQIMVGRGDAMLDTPEKIERSMALWSRSYDCRTVLWRASAYTLQEFYVRRATGDFVRRYYAKVKEVTDRFDPLPVARKASRRHGMGFLLYMTLFDHGAPADVLYAGTTPFPWQDRAMIEHPEWQTIDLRGTPHWGVLEPAYAEARALVVGRITTYVRRFDADGVYLCTRTHSLPALHADQFGFSPPIVQEYRRRYGIDITRDPRFDYRNKAFAPQDEALERWRRLRGEYLVQFYRELRRALPGKTIYTGIPRGRYLGPPYGNLYLDWESIVREHLVDGLVLGVHSGKWLHPKLAVPHAEIGYKSSEDDNIGIPDRKAAIANYGPLCLRHGVKMFLQGCRGNADRMLARREPALTGFMLNPPSGGQSARIACPASLEFGRRDITIEALVYSSEAPAEFDKRWPRIMSRYDHVDGDRMRGWEWILLPDGTFRFRVHFAATPSGSGKEVALSTSALFPVRRWVHVATVIDQTHREIRLLFDGKVVAQTACPDLPVHATPGLELWLGRYGGSGTQVFQGRIDELHLHTGTEILGSTKRPSIPGPGTLILCHFDRLEDDSRLPALPPPREVFLMGNGGLAESLPGFGKALPTGH